MESRPPLARAAPIAVLVLGACLLQASAQNQLPTQAPTPNGARPPDQAPSAPPTSPQPPPPADAALVAVLPFENRSEDRSLYWVAEAIADGIFCEIRQRGGKAVEREERLSVVDELGVPALSTLTFASQIRVAESLGAATLVTGTFSTKEGSLIVQTRVVDVVAARAGPWVSVSGSAKDVYTLQSAIFSALRGSLPSGRGDIRRARVPTGAPEDGAPQTAYEYVLKSLYEDAPRKRELLLRRALDLAPDYLRAQVALARIYRDGEQIDKAAGALSRIVTHDQELAAEAQNLLAEIELDRAQPAAAESALRRSLATHETVRAHLLLAKIALARADRAQARAELDRARSLDPNEPELSEIESALADEPR